MFDLYRAENHIEQTETWLKLLKKKKINMKITETQVEAQIVINEVIQKLKQLDVTGEQMEHILNKVGMTDQMLRQLIMNNPESDTVDLLAEKREISDAYLRSLPNSYK